MYLCYLFLIFTVYQQQFNSLATILAIATDNSNTVYTI